MSARRTPAPVAWAVLVARTVAAALVVVTCGLAVWSVLPRAAGWAPSVVMTGSMQPRLHPGDVVLSAPASALTVHPGQIILVVNPAMPSHMLMHRFVRFTPSGDLITKGDANPHEDSTPVPPLSVKGLPRLKLPYIGIGVVWLHNREWGKLSLTVLLLVALFSLLGGNPSASEQDDLPAVDVGDPTPAAAQAVPAPQPAPATTRRLPDRDPLTGRFIPRASGR